MLVLLKPGSLASAKTPSDLGAQSRAEKFLVESLRRSGLADFSKLPPGQRTVRGSFLRQILFAPSDSQIPNRVVIGSVTVEGALRIQAEYETPVTRNVVFVYSIFDEVWLYSARFDQSLAFATSRFRKGLFLDRVHIKGDLLLSSISGISPDHPVNLITLRGAHIEGQLTMQGLQVASVVAPRVHAQSLRVDVRDEGTGDMDFSQLESESVSVTARSFDPNDVVRSGSLSFREASIKETLLLRRLSTKELIAPGLRVGGHTDLDRVTIAEALDLSWASLGVFQWNPSCAGKGHEVCWPKSIHIGGLQFREMSIGQYIQGNEDSGGIFKDDRQLDLQFLNRAEFSESGYSAYEQSLRGVGLVSNADDVYRAMRDRKRDSMWHESKGFLGTVGTAVYVVIDFGQKVFLGYGRSALQPLLWSLAFVIFGTIMFWEKRMQTVGEHPPQFSALWYSLELFLPVVDLGVAKSWRPKSAPLLTYARIHQLAGWILIPVALAAVTGVFK